MDRIRKALDRARQERDRTFAPAATEAPVFEAKPTQSANEVRFTRTRTFEPSAAHLESQRLLNPSAPGSGQDIALAAFRMLRTQVLLRMDEHGWRSLAVVSPGSEDGKTTTAINLAVSLASDHRHTVLLVDCDLRQPKVAARWGIHPERGTDDVLKDEARIEECLVHPQGFDRLVVLPARGPMQNSSEALAGPRCREMVDELRMRYVDRILVFDLPPILGADDALAFAPLVDCCLMVICEGYTRREDLLRSMELLRNTPIVGTVLNRASDVTSGYG